MGLVVRIEEGDGTVQRMGFTSSPVRIGRNALNDVQLDHPMVSQWHAMLRFDESTGHVTVMDLGSTNGTAFNGARLTARSPVAVRPQDIIFFGPLKVSITLADIPPELLRALDRPSSFDAKLLTGNATMMFQGPPTSALSEDPKTVFMKQGQLPTDIQSVQTAVDRTRPAYEAFRQAWTEVERQLEGRLRDTPPHLHQYIIEAIAADLPLVTKMPDWKAFLARHNLSAGPKQVDPVEWLHRVKHGGNDAPREPVNPMLGMERVGALLETFADSFAALRRGFKQFGEEMALQLVHEETPLTSAHDGRQVLEVLLDWNEDGNQSIDDLKRGFADLAMHQVALLHGIVEGVRAMLVSIGPETLAAPPSSSTGLNLIRVNGAPKPGLFSFLPVVKRSNLWSLYRVMHRSLVEEDRFTREVFGRAFARAYFDMTGGRVQETGR